VTISFLFWYGLARSVLWLRHLARHPGGNAEDLTLVFAFGNIAYFTALVILYHFAAQNRIRLEVFTVLAGSLIALAIGRGLPARFRVRAVGTTSRLSLNTGK
jgi:hypothetical protein